MIEEEKVLDKILDKNNKGIQLAARGEREEIAIAPATRISFRTDEPIRTRIRLR